MTDDMKRLPAPNDKDDTADSRVTVVIPPSLLPAIIPTIDEGRWGPADYDDEPLGQGYGMVALPAPSTSPKGKASPEPKAKPKPPKSIAWAKVYPEDHAKAGQPFTCIENTQAMLTHYGVTVRHNLMTHEDEFDGASGLASADQKQNASMAQIREWARKHGLSSTAALEDHLTLLVASNPYHPVAEFIRSAPWDGVDRVPALFGSLTLANQDPEHVALMGRVFVAWGAAAAMAALVPPTAREGMAAQFVLVLQGDQGVRKTRWIMSLVPKGMGWAREGIMLDPSSRDSVQQATSVWIGELGELDATFRKSDVAALKAFLTSKNDTYRAPYARKSETISRRTAFAASVNPKAPLHDDTGNRRFPVLAVTDCNVDHGVDLQQFWAQMASLGPEACYLSKADEKAITETNKDHEAADPLADLAAMHWEASTEILPKWETLRAVLAWIDDERHWTTGDARAIAKILRDRLKARTKILDGYTLYAVTRKNRP